MINLGTLVDYLDYFGWIVVFGGIIASAILLTLGRTSEGRKIIFGTAIGAFILAFGWAIINSLVPSQSYNIPGWSDISYVIYAAAAFSTIFAAIELVRGNGREGLGYFLTAIALIFILNYGPSIFGVNNINLQPPQVNAVFGIGIPGTQYNLGVPVAWLIDMPNMSAILSIQVDGQPVYQFVENVAFAIMGIVILGDIIWTLWNKEDVFDTLKDVSKDVAGAVLLIISMPYIYELFATVINYIANSLVQPVQGTITTMGDTAAGLIAAGFATGYFVPALADIASDILFSLAIAGMLAAIRFFAIAAALIVFPVFMALWIFPPLRGAVKFLVEFVLGMAFSGIIAAGIFLTLLSIGTSNPIFAAILYLASPVLYGFLPMMLSFVGGSGLLSLGTNLLPFRKGGGGRRGAGGGQTTTTPAQTPAQNPTAPLLPASTTALGTTRLRQGSRTRTLPVRPSGGQTQTIQATVPLSSSSSSSSTTQKTPPLDIKNPPPAPVGIIERLRNRKTITGTEEAIKSLDQSELKGMKKVDERILPAPKDKLEQFKKEMEYMARTAPPIPGIHEDLKKYGEKRARELGIAPEQRRLQTYRESAWYALGRGMAQNLKAGTLMTAQKFGQKFDNWLNAQGVSIRPFEAIENKVKETRLRTSRTKAKRTK